MAYDAYKDQNGVTWTVGWRDGGHTAIATVLEDAQPRYEPDPGDVTAKMDPGGLQLFGAEILKGDHATDEQMRVLFIELSQKIEAIAAQHRRSTVLRVSASPPMSPWILLGLVVAAAWALDEIGE
jgi:hypothetical protein